MIRPMHVLLHIISFHRNPHRFQQLKPAFLHSRHHRSTAYQGNGRCLCKLLHKFIDLQPRLPKRCFLEHGHAGQIHVFTCKAPSQRIQRRHCRSKSFRFGSYQFFSCTCIENRMRRTHAVILRFCGDKHGFRARSSGLLHTVNRPCTARRLGYSEQKSSSIQAFVWKIMKKIKWCKHLNLRLNIRLKHVPGCKCSVQRCAGAYQEYPLKLFSHTLDNLSDILSNFNGKSAHHLRLLHHILFYRFPHGLSS